MFPPRVSLSPYLHQHAIINLLNVANMMDENASFYDVPHQLLIQDNLVYMFSQLTMAMNLGKTG